MKKNDRHEECNESLSSFFTPARNTPGAEELCALAPQYSRGRLAAEARGGHTQINIEVQTAGGMIGHRAVDFFFPKELGPTNEIAAK